MAGKYTTWGYTLNNYTDQDLISVRNPPEWVREHVWELERGENDTPHVQGWFRCKQQVRTSYIAKHWLSRAFLKGLSTEEYKQNMKNYAQKQDKTATSAATHKRSDEPILFPAVIPEMIVEEIDSLGLYPIGTSTHPWELVEDPHDVVYQLVCLSSQRERQDWEKEGFVLSGLHREYPHQFSDKAVFALAKQRLVERYRVETLVSRPEVDTIVRSYYEQILKRIKHKRTNALPEEEDDYKEEVRHAGKTPPLPPSPPESDAESDCD